jgi:two-component system, chemotaxis family, response regulator Rcp1
VVLTTSQADADVAQAYDLKANCYIKKPPQLDAFQIVVQSIAKFWMGTAHVPGD